MYYIFKMKLSNFQAEIIINQVKSFSLAANAGVIVLILL